MAEPAPPRAPFNPFAAPPKPPTNAAPAEIRSVTGTTPTRPTNSMDMSPEQRWAADQAAADRADPWRDQSRVLARDAAGNFVQREKVIGADGEPKAGDAVDKQDPSAEPAAEGADARIKIGDVELSEAEIRKMMENQAAENLRKALVPPTPAEYKIELPKDLKLPEGASFNLASVNDPVKGAAIQSAQDWAHRNGLSQPQFSELLGLYAAAQSHEQVMISKAALAEREKLGVAGPARVDAIAQWLKGRYGEPTARPMLNTLLTEAQCRIWEDIVTHFTNGGGGAFRNTGRVPPETQTISDEAWNKMSYSQQVDYSRNATARANAGAGGRG